MLEHTKKRLTNGKLKGGSRFYLSERGQFLRLPKALAEECESYAITDRRSAERIKNRFNKSFALTSEEAFLEINQKYTKAGALLKAIRLREGMSQKEFAEKINVEQGDLSKMEHGRRSIGKDIAHRISKQFNVNYRLFL
jgi:DNA-binding transcriptional regulator YiaG